jgi:beta-lactamase superfamily II metal-dependent hydrolase
VICTHPDGDHASGLRKILEHYHIGALWMNRPWLYAKALLPHFKDQRITVESLEKRLRDAYPYIAELEAQAIKEKIPIREAFQGQKIGAFTVLSPSKNFYQSLLLESLKSPATKTSTIDGGILAYLSKLQSNVKNWIVESWSSESLPESCSTSAENESSIVQYANFGGKTVVLTGDAGIRAMNEAADFLEGSEGYIPTPRFIQIPHHGSRNNIAPSILNRWLGRPTLKNSSDITAFVSAAQFSATHPRKAVMNAFIRRGAKVVSTKGRTIRHYYNMPIGWGWSPATPEAFSVLVEPYTDNNRNAASF